MLHSPNQQPCLPGRWCLSPPLCWVSRFLGHAAVGRGSRPLGKGREEPGSSWSWWKISLAAVGCEFCTGFLLGKPMYLNTSPYALLSPPPGEEVTFSTPLMRMMNHNWCGNVLQGPVTLENTWGLCPRASRHCAAQVPGVGHQHRAGSALLLFLKWGGQEGSAPSRDFISRECCGEHMGQPVTLLQEGRRQPTARVQLLKEPRRRRSAGIAPRKLGRFCELSFIFFSKIKRNFSCSRSAVLLFLTLKKGLVWP